MWNKMLRFSPGSDITRLVRSFVKGAAAMSSSVNGNTIVVRLATADDFEKVLEMSEGIYDGEDYIPNVFHQWLKVERRLVLIGELQGNPIALQVVDVTQKGESFTGRSMRIHPKYRGQRLGYSFEEAANDFVRRRFPQVSRKYLICFSDEITPMTLAKGIGSKAIMEEKFYKIENINTAENVQLDTSSLFPMGKRLTHYDQEGAVRLLTNPNTYNLLEQKIIVRDFGVFHLPDDIGKVVKQGDHILADVTPQEIYQGKLPQSLSHGRVLRTTGMTQWHCSVFTDDGELFKEHVRRHLFFAGKNISQFDCYIFQGSLSKFDGHEILKDELSRLKLNKEVTSASQVVFEKVLD